MAGRTLSVAPETIDTQRALVGSASRLRLEADDAAIANAQAILD